MSGSISSRPGPINDSPDELLVHMLAHATPGSVVAMSGVSRRFYAVTNTELVWRPMVIRLIGQTRANQFFPLIEGNFTWKQTYRFRFLPDLIPPDMDGIQARAEVNNPGPVVIDGQQIDRPHEKIFKPELVDGDTTFRVVNCSDIVMTDIQGNRKTFSGLPGTLINHFSFDGRLLFAVRSDGWIMRWDTVTEESMSFPSDPMRDSSQNYTYLNSLAKEGYLVHIWVSDRGYAIQIIDIKTGRFVTHTISRADSNFWHSLHIEEEKLYMTQEIFGLNYKILIWDLKTLELEKTINGCGFLAIAHKTNRIVGCSCAGTQLHVLDLNGQERRRFPLGDLGGLGAISGDLFFIRDLPQVISVYNMKTGKRLGTNGRTLSDLVQLLSPLLTGEESVSSPPRRIEPDTLPLPADLFELARKKVIPWEDAFYYRPLSEMLALHRLNALSREKHNRAIQTEGFPQMLSVQKPTVIHHGVLFSTVNSCDVEVEGEEKVVLKGTPGTLLTHLAHDGTYLYGLRSDGVIAKWRPESGDYEEIAVPRPFAQDAQMLFLAKEGFIVTASSHSLEIINTNTQEFRIIEGIKLDPSHTQMFIRDNKLYRVNTGLPESYKSEGEIHVLNLTTGQPEPTIRIALNRRPGHYRSPSLDVAPPFQSIRDCKLLNNKHILVSTQFESIILNLQGWEMGRMDGTSESTVILGVLAFRLHQDRYSDRVHIGVYNIKEKKSLVEVNAVSPHALEDLVHFCQGNQDLMNSELSGRPASIEDVSIRERVADVFLSLHRALDEAEQRRFARMTLSTMLRGDF